MDLDQSTDLNAKVQNEIPSFMVSSTAMLQVTAGNQNDTTNITPLIELENSNRKSKMMHTLQENVDATSQHLNRMHEQQKLVQQTLLLDTMGNGSSSAQPVQQIHNVEHEHLQNYDQSFSKHDDTFSVANTSRSHGKTEDDTNRHGDGVVSRDGDVASEEGSYSQTHSRTPGDLATMQQTFQSLSEYEMFQIWAAKSKYAGYSVELPMEEYRWLDDQRRQTNVLNNDNQGQVNDNSPTPPLNWSTANIYAQRNQNQNVTDVEISNDNKVDKEVDDGQHEVDRNVTGASHFATQILNVSSATKPNANRVNTSSATIPNTESNKNRTDVPEQHSHVAGASTGDTNSDVESKTGNATAMQDMKQVIAQMQKDQATNQGLIKSLMTKIEEQTRQHEHEKRIMFANKQVADAKLAHQNALELQRQQIAALQPVNVNNTDKLAQVVSDTARRAALPQFGGQFTIESSKVVQYIRRIDDYVSLHEIKTDVLAKQMILPTVPMKYRLQFTNSTYPSTLHDFKRWLTHTFGPVYQREDMVRELGRMLYRQQEDPNLVLMRFGAKLKLINDAITIQNEVLPPIDQLDLITDNEKLVALKKLFYENNNSVKHETTGSINRTVAKEVAKRVPRTLEAWNKLIVDLKNSMFTSYQQCRKENRFINYPPPVTADDIVPTYHPSQRGPKLKQNNQKYKARQHFDNKKYCIQCKQFGHDIASCPRLNNQRFKRQRTNNANSKQFNSHVVCHNCLGRGHYANKCTLPDMQRGRGRGRSRGRGRGRGSQRGRGRGRGGYRGSYRGKGRGYNSNRNKQYEGCWNCGKMDHKAIHCKPTSTSSNTTVKPTTLPWQRYKQEDVAKHFHTAQKQKTTFGHSSANQASNQKGDLLVHKMRQIQQLDTISDILTNKYNTADMDSYISNEINTFKNKLQKRIVFAKTNKKSKSAKNSDNNSFP